MDGLLPIFGCVRNDWKPLYYLFYSVQIIPAQRRIRLDSDLCCIRSWCNGSGHCNHSRDSSLVDLPAHLDGIHSLANDKRGTDEIAGDCLCAGERRHWLLCKFSGYDTVISTSNSIGTYNRRTFRNIFISAVFISAFGHSPGGNSDQVAHDEKIFVNL